MPRHFFIDSSGRIVMRHPIHFHDNISTREINEEDNDWFKREENKSPIPPSRYKDLSHEHIRALHEYSTDSYPINRELINAHEHGGEINKIHLSHIKHLDSVTNRPLGHEHHLYSGLGFHPGEMLKRAKDGVVHLPAYTSMTHDKDIAASFAEAHGDDCHILHIRMRPTDKGVRMVDMSDSLERDGVDEKETVLPRGTNLKINPTPEKAKHKGKTYHIWHGEIHSQPTPSVKHMAREKISESFPELNSMRRLVECVILDINK